MRPLKLCAFLLTGVFILSGCAGYSGTPAPVSNCGPLGNPEYCGGR